MWLLRESQSRICPFALESIEKSADWLTTRLSSDGGSQESANSNRERRSKVGRLGAACASSSTLNTSLPLRSELPQPRWKGTW